MAETDDILLRRNLLKATLAEYDKDLKDLVNIKPVQFDTARIATMITSTPPRKWHAAQGVVDATVRKKQAEQTLKAIKAKNMLVARNNTALTAATDRTAWVDSRPEVQAAEIDVINADADLTAARLAYECLDDLFTAGKKIMDYLNAQDRATRQYNKFVDEGSRNA
jgi:hypothetical protein